jgi:hypothetical protein
MYVLALRSGLIGVLAGGFVLLFGLLRWPYPVLIAFAICAVAVLVCVGVGIAYFLFLYNEIRFRPSGRFIAGALRDAVKGT